MMLVFVHVFAAGLGIVTGFVALYAAKGATLHRRSGTLFLYAMVTMALLGAMLAAVWGRSPASNVPVGLLTAYLVATGVTTVRPPSAGSRRLDVGAMVVALATGMVLLAFGVRALESSTATLPAPPFFIFASIALLAGLGDLRVMRAGGARALPGARRLARHLWRMSCALLIAAFSFLGQAALRAALPDAIRVGPLLALPPLLVFVTMIYWLWRVRVRRTLRGLVGVSAPPAASMARSPAA